MGSSDWMKRNLDRRVEVMTPILDEEIKATIKMVLDFQMKDNVKSRNWNATLNNNYRAGGRKKIRSQMEIYNYFKNQLKELEVEE